MIPIRDLIHRIQWDEAFGRAAFEIAYLDRVAGGTLRVPFGDVRLESGWIVVRNATEEDGSQAAIPLHRIREVWRDGQLIWQRS
jgi:uncharacterized protein (UPF0248 family)